MRAGSRAGTRAGPCAGLAEPRCAGAAVGPFVAVTGGLRRSGTCRAGLSCAGLPIRNRVAARPPRRGRPRPAAAPRASHRRRSAQLAVVAAGRVPRARREGSAAALAYRTILALEPDLYTAIAHAELLPRQDDATNALATLAALPETDAVLIRRGAAWRQHGDSRWTGVSAVLAERNAELRCQSDDPNLHGRELALAALWLPDDVKRPLALARQNLLLQRESLNWWVALQSARRARDSAAVADTSAQIRVAGLRGAPLGIAAPEPPGAASAIERAAPHGGPAKHRTGSRRHRTAVRCRGRVNEPEDRSHARPLPRTHARPSSKLPSGPATA